MLDNVTVKFYVDWSQAQTALKGLSSSMWQAHSWFSNINTAMWKTYNQLTSWARWASMFMWAIAGISIINTVNNLKEFSSAFGLLNATIRMKMPENISMVKNAMFEISNMTGESVKSVTDSMNQLLSSWVTPDAMEWTKEWKKQMKDI